MGFSTRVMLSDGPTMYPICLDKKMEQLAHEAFMPLHDEYTRAHEIWKWMVQNIQYCRRGARERYRNAMEVFYDGNGNCAEKTHLFLALARYTGIPAQYTYVSSDSVNGRIAHACAAADLEGELVFVGVSDPCFNYFPTGKEIYSDMRHLEWYFDWRGGPARCWDWYMRARQNLQPTIEPRRKRKEDERRSDSPRFDERLRCRNPKLFEEYEQSVQRLREALRREPQW